MTSLQYYNLGIFFKDVVDRYSICPALIYVDYSITYSEFNKLVESLSLLLVSKGCQKGDVIAIGHNKEPASYAMMHAALKVGVAYVVIDVESPIERNSLILEVSTARLIFFDDDSYKNEMNSLSRVSERELIFLEQSELLPISDIDRSRLDQVMKGVDAATIAYIMFTSGTTGVPKGVAVTHENLLHFIGWGKSYFDITTDDIFANLSPMYFDNSVFDFYVGMFSGAALSPIKRELLVSPYELVSYVEKFNCTIWFSVPTLLIYLVTMKAISNSSLCSLRAVVFGGEGYPKIELKKLYDFVSDRTAIVNVYGPTECTCICSAHKISDDDFADLSGLPTLGTLNQNFDYRIIDNEGNDTDCGELCLIGPNVAAGYYNDIERTNASFSLLTEPERFMKRMYHTGDIVRYMEGKFYFIGRMDNQIKHMGYRIELEEIEAALVNLEPVNQAAVIYHRASSAYGKIVGFISCETELEEKSILNELAEYLPGYMLPSKIISMSELPKNPNGKVDRKKLAGSLN